MGIVMLIMGAGLAFCAWRTDDTACRWFWGVFAVLNIACATNMARTHDVRAFHLMPAAESDDAGSYRD